MYNFRFVQSLYVRKSLFELIDFFIDIFYYNLKINLLKLIMNREENIRKYLNEINFEIVRLNKSSLKDNEILSNLKNVTTDTKFIISKTKEIQENELKRKEKISELENKKTSLLNDEFVFEKNTNKNEKKTSNITNIYENRNKNIYVNSDNLKYLENRKNKDYDYFYKNFCKINETFPTYMTDKLKEMPNNRGYIWRNCYFYGEKPREKGQPDVLFEKKGQCLFIHEYYKNEHRLYEKIGTGRKNLISTTERIKKT